MKAIFLTDRGLVRKHNEDFGGIYYNQANQALAIIADGMGGHQAGDVASQMTVDMMAEKWGQSQTVHAPNVTEVWLKEAMQEVNQAIFQQAQLNDELKGMGTTVVIAIIAEECLTVGHIGDSRCYIANDNGFNQITEDHSLVNLLMQSGEITPEDAKTHPRRNVVSRALGTSEDVEVDIQSLSIEENNKLLLCSDGLTDKITNDELSEIITTVTDLEATAQDLVSLANERGGEDNISLILIKQPAFPKEVGEDRC